MGGFLIRFHRDAFDGWVRNTHAGLSREDYYSD